LRFEESGQCFACGIVGDGHGHLGVAVADLCCGVEVGACGLKHSGGRVLIGGHALEFVALEQVIDSGATALPPPNGVTH
jgi:hypothetical protein